MMLLVSTAPVCGAGMLVDGQSGDGSKQREVTPGEAIALVRSWLGAWEVGDEEAGLAELGAIARVPGARVHPQAVAVTVRADRQVLGSGIALSETVAERRLLAEATTHALAEARSTARRRAGAGVSEEAALEAVRRRAAVAIEFGGRLAPVAAQRFADLNLLARPGIDGLAARVGDRFEAVFPSELIGTNRTPSEGARMLAARFDLPPAELDALREEHGLVVYTFPTVQLAEVPGLRAPVPLLRGGRVVPPSGVTRQTLVEAADAVARNIMTNAVRSGDEPVALLPAYHAPTDTIDREITTAAQHALSAYTLARYANLDGADAELSASATGSAWLLLDSARQRSIEVSPTVLDNAALVLAWSEVASRATGGVVDRAPIDEFAASVLRELIAAAENADPSGSVADDGPLALAAFAIARSAPMVFADDDGARDTADGLVRRLFRAHDVGSFVGLMPWLALAELELHPMQTELPALDALDALRGLVADHRLSEDDAGVDEPDLAGGVVFTAGTNPLPTWHTLRPTAFMAAALGDPRLTPQPSFHERVAELTPMLRFGLNLVAATPEAHQYPSPERGIGGVRLATWDHTITPDANAMGLLTFVTAVEASDRRLRSQLPTDRR